jgi:signal transduction histidine kinase
VLPAGLRPRLVAALVLTAAVTLAAAALALLQPLQERLREQTASSARAATLTARPGLERALARGDAFGEVLRLANRLDARVRIYDPLRVEAVEDVGTGPDGLLQAYRALRERRAIVAIGDEDVRVAARLRTGQVLIVGKRFTDVEATVAEVRDAFLVAALVGLAVAAVLGFALSATLLARLARLRAAALANEPVPPDPTRDEVGDLARALAAMQDGLRRQEDARRTFVATASHELRTPLTSVQGMLELLDEDIERGDVDLEDAHAQIQRAQRQLRRLEHLAGDLLDLSRLDAEVVLRCEPVELGEVCRAVGAEFERRAGERGVRLAVVPPIGPCWGRGDANAVARIVRILLDNALRFAPPGTAVRVVTAYHGEQATVEVADRGPGVPATERERIFARFQRGTATGGEGGFGLGLAIGRELAERLGGSLVLASGDGPGARFVLSLPIELPAGGRETERAPAARG